MSTAADLVRFLLAFACLALPGVPLAARLSLGRHALDRCIHGCCLGIAGAIYLGSAISHFDLRWFYPVWIIVGIVLLIAPRRRTPAMAAADNDRRSRRWLIGVLLLVATTRFAAALPNRFPPGDDPPNIHVLLADKILLTHHAVTNWEPFDDAPLTYPTGAHMLLALLAAISGLPVYTAYNDLVPLLGVLATAQAFLLTRCATGRADAGLYAAFAYGMWAAVGSIDFYWLAALPNQTAALLLVSTISVWLEEGTRRQRLPAISLLFAATILSHHHTQLASAAVFLAVGIVAVFLPRYRSEVGFLAIAVLIAAAADFFFLIHYVLRITTLKSTNALHSEWPLDMSWWIRRYGYAYLLAAVAGVFLCLRKQVRCHAAPFCACAALIAAFVTCEYVLPIWLSAPGHLYSTALTPSHFLTDMSCFLAVFAGLAIAEVQGRFDLCPAAVLAVMLVISASQIDAWRDIGRGPDFSNDYLAACQWVRNNTSADTILLTDQWGDELAWRRGTALILTDSEQRDAFPESRRVAMILAGQIPPSSTQMKILRIDQPPTDPKLHVLWRGKSGLALVQLWPKG